MWVKNIWGKSNNNYKKLNLYETIAYILLYTLTQLHIS